jgi:hypothetical protein
VIRGGWRAHIRLGGIFANLQHGLTKSFFLIRMFCLRLCPVLLYFHIGYLLVAFILIRFWQEIAAKTVKISVAEVMVQQQRSNGETAFGACLQMAVKKNLS